MAKLSHSLKAIVDGWLDREGKFYPCKFNHHDEAVGQLLKKLKLKHPPEYLGWIKVHNAGCWFFRADDYIGRQHIKPTESQEYWLLNNGYEVESER